MTRVAVAILVCCLASASRAATPVGGKRGSAAAATSLRGKLLPDDVLERLRGQLRGDDVAAGAAAAQQLGESGASNAIEPLLEVLVVGTAPARAEVALDALAKLANPATIDALELYAGHHNPALRRRAVAALGTVSDARVVPVLMARLGDQAPEVRAAAAEALAGRKEKKATGRMLKLVKKNDPGAAGPLGQLATPDLIPEIADLQGGVSDEVLATTLGEYIKRGDVSDRLRVEVIKTMGKLSGAATTAALIEYLAAVPPKEERASQREAQKIVDDRSKQR